MLISLHYIISEWRVKSCRGYTVLHFFKHRVLFLNIICSESRDIYID